MNIPQKSSREKDLFSQQTTCAPNIISSLSLHADVTLAPYFISEPSPKRDCLWRKKRVKRMLRSELSKCFIWHPSSLVTAFASAVGSVPGPACMLRLWWRWSWKLGTGGPVPQAII